VKIYDSSTYQVVHSLDFPAPVLSMGCSVRILIINYLFCNRSKIWKFK